MGVTAEVRLGDTVPADPLEDIDETDEADRIEDAVERDFRSVFRSQQDALWAL